MIIDVFNAMLRALVAGYVGQFGFLDPLVGLVIASVLVGVAMLWVVGRTSDQGAIIRARKRMQARLLEMRLYRDEPGLILRAQGNLLLENSRYVGHMLRPALFLALPMVVLYAHFDAVYGRRPLRVGETALLSAETELEASDLALSGTGPLEVDSVPVSTAAGGEIVWRVRAKEDGLGSLALETPHGTVVKAAEAGDALSYVSATRANSWWRRLLLAPGESGYETESVVSVSIGYPSREIGALGWDTHWAVWFLAVSLASAYLLKGLFGVAL